MFQPSFTEPVSVDKLRVFLFPAQEDTSAIRSIVVDDHNVPTDTYDLCESPLTELQQLQDQCVNNFQI